MKVKLFVRRVLLLLLGATLAAGLAELGLRLHGWATDTDYTLYAKELTRADRLPDGLLRDELGLTVLHPRARVLATTSDFSVRYEINALGMRDRAHPARRASRHHQRLLVLGDSLTFGEGVPAPRTFAGRLESMLNADLLNYAVPGYGAGQALALYLQRRREVDHDLVVLFFAATLYRRRHLEPDDPVVGRQRPGGYIPANDPALAPNPWATDHAFLVSYLYYHYKVWSLRARLEGQDAKQWGAANGRSRRDTRRSTLNDPALDARAVGILRRLSASAREGGRGLVVVNIEPGVTFPLFEGLSEELTYIDLSEELRQAAQAGSLRFKYDRHYNPETHRLIARALAPRLAGLMPRR